MADRGVDVLIVDDDGAVAESTADLFGTAGLTTLVAATMHEASEVVSGTAVGVVIVDHHLAQVSGAADGRDCPIAGGPVPPVILVSAMGGDELLEVQRRFGDKVYAYLAKPVPPGRLVGVVKEALGGPGGHAVL